VRCALPPHNTDSLRVQVKVANETYDENARLRDVSEGAHIAIPADDRAICARGCSCEPIHRVNHGGKTMGTKDNTFIYVATYPDEIAAKADYQVVKDLRAGGLIGSYDAAIVTKDPDGKVHANKDETATRHGAWWGVAAGAAVGVLFPPAILGAAAAGGAIGGVSGHLAKGLSRSSVKQLGDFIDPGHAGLVVVGEGKVEEAIESAITRAEKQTAEELGVDPKDIDRALQQAMKEM